jgi:hypothetical protein
MSKILRDNMGTDGGMEAPDIWANIELCRQNALLRMAGRALLVGILADAAAVVLLGTLFLPIGLLVGGVFMIGSIVNCL